MVAIFFVICSEAYNKKSTPFEGVLLWYFYELRKTMLIRIDES